MRGASGGFLPRWQRQALAWRNSYVWMRPVRLLIRDCAPPFALPFREETNADTQTHTKHWQARKQGHNAAGGHLSAWTNQSQQSQQQLIEQIWEKSGDVFVFTCFNFCCYCCCCCFALLLYVPIMKQKNNLTQRHRAHRKLSGADKAYARDSAWEQC